MSHTPAEVPRDLESAARWVLNGIATGEAWERMNLLPGFLRDELARSRPGGPSGVAVPVLNVGDRTPYHHRPEVVARWFGVPVRSGGLWLALAVRVLDLGQREIRALAAQAAREPVRTLNAVWRTAMAVLEVDPGALAPLLDHPVIQEALLEGGVLAWAREGLGKALLDPAVSASGLKRDGTPPTDEEPEEEGASSSGGEYEAYRYAPLPEDEGSERDWEAQQPQRVRALLARIRACPSLAALARLGQEVYAADLTPQQKRVAWTYWRARQAVLVQKTVRRASPQARRWLDQMGRTPKRALPRLGAQMVQAQKKGGTPPTTEEWSAIWLLWRWRSGRGWLGWERPQGPAPS